VLSLAGVLAALVLLWQPVQISVGSRGYTCGRPLSDNHRRWQSDSEAMLEAGQSQVNVVVACGHRFTQRDLLAAACPILGACAGALGSALTPRR
jgi:hypothetical protein